MKDWRACRPPKRPVGTSLYKELSAPYCVAGVVHRAGLGSDGMFLALPPPGGERQSNLDAIRGPPWDRFGSHMLLSFQRPPAPSGAVTPLPRRTERLFEAHRAGPTSIAPAARLGNFCQALRADPSDRAAQCSAGPDGLPPSDAGLTHFRQRGGIA